MEIFAKILEYKDRQILVHKSHDNEENPCVNIILWLDGAYLSMPISCSTNDIEKALSVQHEIFESISSENIGKFVDIALEFVYSEE